MGFLSQFDALHEQAIQATGGLTDFGSKEYQEPLRILLGDYDDNTRFGDVGRQMLLGAIVGDLAGRLIEEQGFKSFPQYANTEIKKPVIIVGMARTGTTVLHRLIGQDPAMQTLPLWLASMPMPRPPRDQWERNPGCQQVQQMLDQMYQLSPLLKKLHPQSAVAADECRFILNHSFWSPTNAASTYLPQYAEWVVNTDARYAYRRYKKTLGLIAGGSNKRWLLKCPSHLWGLPALLGVFPDACVVMTHRDPASAVTSIISVVYELRKLLEPGITPEVHGRESQPHWGSVPRKAEKDRSTIAPSRIFDLHIDEIKADPVASVERIYQHFGIPVADEARGEWEKQVRDDPNGGHAAHHAKPEQFGFTAQDVYSNVGAYYERYLDIAKASRPR